MIKMISVLNEYAFGILVPVFLLLLGIFYCIRLRFFHFLHPIKVARGLFKSGKRGTASSIKAFALALAGTLGVGNIVGVASALALGGAGAIFWMWVSALLAMILKYAEIVLAIRHRRTDGDGKYFGSAMLYIRACFRESRLGRILAAVFAIFCILNSISMGSMIQVNAAASAFGGAFGIPELVVGIALAAVVLWTMCKGRSGIITQTSRLVPFMTLGFVGLSVAVICMRPAEAVASLRSVFEGAFSVRSGVGGIMGFLMSRSLRYGTMRGILSNEAGCGTAPAAHAVSSCDDPVKQGFWGMLEVFVDTILLCTLTAIVIMVSYPEKAASDGNYMMMTLDAFVSVLGEKAGYFIAVSVLLFGLATVLCWGYYGLESVKYLFGGKSSERIFLAAYVVSVVLGAIISSSVIWELADLSIGAMTMINLSVLLIMNKEVKEETERYLKNGE